MNHTIPPCLALICTLLCVEYAEAQRIDRIDADALLHEAERATLQFSRDESALQVRTLLEIGILHGEAGNREKAKKTFRRALNLLKTTPVTSDFDDVDRDMFTIGVAKAQTQMAAFSLALKSVDSVGDFSRRHLGLLQIVQYHAGKGDISRARTTCRRMDPKAGSWRYQAFVAIGVAQAKLGDFTGAREMLGLLDGLELDTDDRHSVRVQKASLLREIAIAQVRRGKFLQSLKTADDIDNATMQIRTLCDVARIQAAKKDTAGAKQTLQRAMCIAHCTGATADIERIAIQQAEISDIDGATRTISKYLTGSAAGRAKLHLSVMYAKAGDQRQADAIFDEGLSLIVDEISDDDNNRLRDLTLKQIHASQSKHALTLARIIPDESVKAHVLTQIVIELIRQDDVRNASRIAEFIDDKNAYPRALAFCELAKARAEYDKSMAKRDFKRALDATAAIPIGGGTDVFAFCELAKAQRQVGFSKMATESFIEARRRAMEYESAGYVALLFQKIARAQAASGDIQAAMLSARTQPSTLLKAQSLLGVIEALVIRQSS